MSSVSLILLGIALLIQWRFNRSQIRINKALQAQIDATVACEARRVKPDTMKEFIGDGIDVEYDSEINCIILTSFDEEISLAADVWQALKSFVKRTMEL